MPKLKRKDLVFNNESHKQLSVGKSRWKKLTFGEVHKCVYVNLLLQFLSLCPLRISMCWNLVLVKVVWMFVWVNNRYFQDKTIQLFRRVEFMCICIGVVQFLVFEVLLKSRCIMLVRSVPLCFISQEPEWVYYLCSLSDQQLTIAPFAVAHSWR